MSKIDFITVQDHINDAKSKISFICSLFNAADTNHLIFNEKSLHGLTQNLWDIDDVLDEADELIDQLKATGREQKRAPATADHQTEAPKADQD